MLLVIDYYGNPVVDAPVAFGGTGVSNWFELQYETDGWTDEGIDGVGAGDGCFTWRDYGLDNDPETLDMGTFNQNHDSFDTTGNGQWDAAEVSEASMILDLIMLMGLLMREKEMDIGMDTQ